MKDNVKTIKKFYIFLGIIVFTIFTLIFLYTLGFRLVSGFKIGRVGQISVTAPLNNTWIYIDNSKKITTSTDNQTVEVSLSPKTHTIIVARESYYPWKKDLEITSNSKIKLDPLFVSQNPSGNIIPKEDPEYLTILNSIKNNTTPTKNNPKKSTALDAIVWTEGKKIFVKHGEKETEVITLQTDVKNVGFYKDRNDAIVFSTSLGVYVIETDKKGGQNFMPIYKGQDPYFVQTDPNYIYVQDDAALMQVLI
jgi:hypothetical protein